MIVTNGGVQRAALALTRENSDLPFEDAKRLVECVLDAIDVPPEIQALAESAIAALDKYRTEHAEVMVLPEPLDSPTAELEGLLSLMLTANHNLFTAIAERRGMYLPADMAGSAVTQATRCEIMLSALGDPIPDGPTWTVNHTEKLKRLAAEAKELETGHGSR